MKALLPFLFALVFLLMPTGCKLVPYVAKSPKATTTTGNATVTQTGDAATPAKAQSDTQTAVLPVPAGSVVTVNESAGTLGVTLATDSTLTLSTRRDVVTGPQSFTLPAPPTPSDEAKGKAALWLRLGLVAGLAAGGFGLVKGWDLLGIGGACVAGACFLGLSIEAIPVWLWVVLGVGGALAVTGPALWHWKLKHFPTLPRLQE